MSTNAARATGADTLHGASTGAITAIDTHAHVFSRALPLAAARRYAPAYDAPLTRYLAQLDRHGISHGVLVQPSFLGTDNGYLMGAIARAPHRLRGIAMIDPEAVATDPSSLDVLALGGIVGIRFNLFGLPDPDLAGAAWQTTLRKIVALGWQIEVHCEAQRLPNVLGGLLTQTGEAIDIVVDHFGRPDPALGIADPGFGYLLTLGATRRVWVKLSAAYRNADPLSAGSLEGTALAAMPLLETAFGLDRLVWGSDWPHTQHERGHDYDCAYALANKLLPTQRARQAVLVDTPARLFGFA
ncbi:hypothetical protein C0Z18_20450 [Trinickia dabaoshanensis]|uniref:Amidohydrolase-related domain-containing protein n=1 Tax=Trinickia dabaoshanensis TaxID=564714 RepID=A0A2N7VJW3_9BURK|nr:amidohydrolase family protein [Trinickia dabaoshanensis]PMS17459.1 hypothetical protein C0Z18_20450 [Trinickia dabaoshanensis]